LFLAALTIAAGLLAVTACRRGVPVLDPGEAPPTMDGTISGRLTTAGGGSRLVGRRVEVVNVETGTRRSVSSSQDGGFTLKVPPGKYRLQVELRPGEAIVNGPETIDINRSDVDSSIVIEITAAPPRPHPADSTRGHEGLGSPIA
jgi:hypothetical protein